MGRNHFPTKTEKKKFLYYDELDPNKTISENSVSYLSLSPQTSKFYEVRFEPPLQRHISHQVTDSPVSSPSPLTPSSLSLLSFVCGDEVEFKVKGDGTHLKPMYGKGKRWDVCCLGLGKKTESDGDTWALTDIAPIKEGEEQTDCSTER